MTRIVVDASAVIAVLANEPLADQCRERMDGATSVLVSAVNHAEVRIKVASLRLNPPAGDTLEIIDVDRNLAEVAAAARIRFPRLNFGDCFAYALARREGLPLLATDRDFETTDIEVIIPAG